MNKTDNSKILFLDRDGVINVERKNDYAKNIDEFIFIDKSAEAVGILSKIFDRIFIVTNQRGVGKGVMSWADLANVHRYMLHEIEKVGGKIDHIYVCTDVNADSVNRKPNIGMAFQALRDYPEIKFQYAIMVGNSNSDIEFGNKAGMKTVLVGDKYAENDPIFNKITAYFPNLYEFALSLYESK